MHININYLEVAVQWHSHPSIHTYIFYTCLIFLMFLNWLEFFCCMFSYLGYVGGLEHIPALIKENVRYIIDTFSAHHCNNQDKQSCSSNTSVQSENTLSICNSIPYQKGAKLFISHKDKWNSLLISYSCRHKLTQRQLLWSIHSVSSAQ